MNAEADIIQCIAGWTGAHREDVILGIGDDAAVMAAPPGQDLVMCTDTLVAGVHFPEGTDAAAIGWKSLAVNLSDLAAMGAKPAWALLALTLPEADMAWIERFATGFSESAVANGVMLVGGDTTQGPLCVSVTAVGFVPSGEALRRTGAREGDGLFVSGPLGDAAAALVILADGHEPPEAMRRRLDRPVPRVELGMALRGRAHAVIDLSDGLLLDTGRMLTASGLGADIEVDAVPRSDDFDRHGGTIEMLLAGGDDYELLCAMPDPAGLPLTRVGTVTAVPGLRCIHSDGRPCNVGTTGYTHFR